MRAPRRAAVVSAALVVVGVLSAPAANALPHAPRPPDPAPTAAHPLQGLRRLTVATIPPVPGARFAIDGQEFDADANGVATTFVTTAQRLAVRAARDQHLTVMAPVVEAQPGVRARFAGWSGPGQYRGGGPVPEEYQRATFDVEYLTSFDFAARDGARVEPRSLQSMSLRSSTGQRLRLRRFDPVWLTGSLAATGPNGLEVRSVSYAVDDVAIRGASVVHRAQQRFFPSRRTAVAIPLLLFDVRFSVEDALLGRRAGSALTLEYPDGSSQRFPLGPGHAVTVRYLPRGSYHARVSGSGPDYAQQLSVSSNAPVTLDVVTWLDVALVVGALLVLVIALLLAGRAIRRRTRRRDDVDLVVAEAEEHPEPELAAAP